MSSADEWVRNAGRRRAVSAIILAKDDQGNPPACWICRQPGADSVDHVLPRSTHPDLTWETGNMQPAHEDCNKSKGANAPTRNLGSSSRRW